MVPSLKVDSRAFPCCIQRALVTIPTPNKIVVHGPFIQPSVPIMLDLLSLYSLERVERERFAPHLAEF